MDQSKYMNEAAHGAETHAGHVADAHADHMKHYGHGMKHDDGMHAEHHHMMMWFHTGYSETVLFKRWNFNTIGGLIWSVIGIFFLAALYEGIKYYRAYLFRKTDTALQYRSLDISGERCVGSEINQIAQPKMCIWMYILEVLLYVIQMVLSYFLMLIFMTYNVALCVAVVLGATTGYILFGGADVTEHCH